MLDSSAAYLAGGVIPSYTVMLFTSDVTISFNTVPADLVECALPGYVRHALSPGGWTLSVASGLVTSLYPTLSWSFAANAGGVTIFGFMVMNTSQGADRTSWGERWATPYPVPAAGGTLTLDLSDYDQSR